MTGAAACMAALLLLSIQQQKQPSSPRTITACMCGNSRSTGHLLPIRWRGSDNASGWTSRHPVRIWIGWAFCTLSLAPFSKPDIIEFGTALQFEPEL